MRVHHDAAFTQHKFKAKALALEMFNDFHRALIAHDLLSTAPLPSTKPSFTSPE